jgi:hypothetical protein
MNDGAAPAGSPPATGRRFLGRSLLSTIEGRKFSTPRKFLQVEGRGTRGVLKTSAGRERQTQIVADDWLHRPGQPRRWADGEASLTQAAIENLEGAGSICRTAPSGLAGVAAGDLFLMQAPVRSLPPLLTVVMRRLLSSGHAATAGPLVKLFGVWRLALGRTCFRGIRRRPLLAHAESLHERTYPWQRQSCSHPLRPMRSSSG